MNVCRVEDTRRTIKNNKGEMSKTHVTVDNLFEFVSNRLWMRAKLPGGFVRFNTPATKCCLRSSQLVRDIDGARRWQVSRSNRLQYRLTDTILGYNEQDLEETLKAIAADIGMAHIAYMRFAPDKSSDASLLTGARTYSVQWQTRYFLKQYILIDPVLAHGSKAVLPFDWEELPRDDPAIQAFFTDAVSHDVGCNGISVPVRNRRGAYSVVSFTSNHSKPEWAVFKKNNMVKLQLISVLIDSAASVNLKLSSPPSQTVEKRRTMSDLGCQRENVPRYL